MNNLNLFNRFKLGFLTFFYICLSIYLFSCLFPSKALAGETFLGIYPPIFQIDAIPPTTIKSPLTIQNNGTDPVTLEIQIKPFTSSNKNTGEISFLPDKQKISGADPNILQKVQILEENNPVDQVLLGPAEEKKLTLSIDLPKQEPPSDYYFSILFISKAQAADQQNSSSVTTGIATNVLFSVGPKDKTTGLLSEFSVPFFLDRGPIPFTVAIENTSRHFITPQGNIVIKNMFNQIIGSVELLPVNILSQTTRFVPDKKFSSQTKAVWQEKVLFGPYSAELTTALSPDGPLIKKTIYFVVLPYQFLAGFILACIFAGIIIFRVRKKIIS